MPDRENVIKGLKCLSQKQEPTANPCKDCGYSDRPNYAICVKDIASDALALLEEQEVCQIPEKVNRDRTCEVYPGKWVRKGSCPHCNKVVHWFTNRKYCGFCGKSVKWE